MDLVLGKDFTRFLRWKSKSNPGNIINLIQNNNNESN